MCDIVYDISSQYSQWANKIKFLYKNLFQAKVDPRVRYTKHEVHVVVNMCVIIVYKFDLALLIIFNIEKIITNNVNKCKSFPKI